ncbi:MAG TPA: DUF58 domain-containing protein [Candidatus Sulfomarinibacteraceae bacterium]|nr:DUF58 domain-containing protein [Candidatus Sulfomarinibacteraceae bacterium]
MYLTTRGILLLLLAAPFIAAATWAPALEWVAGGYVLLAALLISLDWRAAGPVAKFEVRRTHDNRLSLGAENPIVITIRNRHSRPMTLQVRDEAPDEFHISRRILHGQLAAGGSWQESYYVRPLRRGDYQFGNINLRWRGPLELAVRSGRIEATEAVKVYPNLLDVRRYDLMLRQNRLQEIGLRHTRLPGQGTEFERLREYRQDDEYRRINWKATARRHRPITVEYQTERSQNIMAVLDTGRMMQSPIADIAKLDYAVNAVLLLAYVATGMGDKVGMMTFADEVEQYLRPRQGRGQFYRMLEQLYAVEARSVEPDYQQGLGYLALKQRRRALIVIFTDLSGGASVNSLLEHTRLLAKHNLPLVVTISDPDIHDMARQTPANSLDVYRRAAAQQLLQERSSTLETLHRQGAPTLDVPATQLSIGVVNRYLQLKRQSRL